MSEAGLLIRGNSGPARHEAPLHGAAGCGAPGGCAVVRPRGRFHVGAGEAVLFL